MAAAFEVADVVVGVSGDAPSARHLREFFAETRTAVHTSVEFSVRPAYRQRRLRRGARGFIFESESRSLDLARKALMFVAGELSPNHAFVHGCGFRLAGRGILLLGPSGAGKSTLLRMLEVTDLVDEDCLFVQHGQMRAGTVRNIRYVPDAETSYIAFSNARVDCVDLDLVALLDRRHPGGYCEGLSGELGQDVTGPDFFTVDRRALSSHRCLRVRCPVYRLGTGGTITATISALRRCAMVRPA